MIKIEEITKSIVEFNSDKISHSEFIARNNYMIAISKQYLVRPESVRPVAKQIERLRTAVRDIEKVEAQSIILFLIVRAYVTLTPHRYEARLRLYGEYIKFVVNLLKVNIDCSDILGMIKVDHELASIELELHNARLDNVRDIIYHGDHSESLTKFYVDALQEDEKHLYLYEEYMNKLVAIASEY